MTLETAKQIKGNGNAKPEQLKEAEAVLRGGMNICEVKADGTRKYVWIKVKPTMTDSESSIQQAMGKYNGRKHPSINNTKKEEPQRTIAFANPIPLDQSKPIHDDDEENEAPNPFVQIYQYLKAKFYQFVRLMDSMVVE